MILVIGYGNSLCGDDGVGPHIVQQLTDSDPLDNVQYRIVYQLTPELVEPISQADVVIFVDAAYGEHLGQITCDELLGSDSRPETGAMTHHVNAGLLLDMAQTLYKFRPAAYVFTLAGENFEVGDSFSPAVEAALPTLFNALKARIILCTNSVLFSQ